MAKIRAFSLAEIMIAVSIIVLLAAIAIPNLYRARINNNESLAIAAMRTISSAAQSYKIDNGRYPGNLTSLGPGAAGGASAGGGAAYCAAIAQPAYLDGVLGCAGQPCWKNGYAYALDGFTNTFSATGTPNAGCGSRDVTGSRGFFVDESGVIRWTDDGCPRTATKESPEVR